MNFFKKVSPYMRQSLIYRDMIEIYHKLHTRPAAVPTSYLLKKVGGPLL